ncbi:uncharacterized protein TRUGW13939_02998 [Talaromyces rugulosus]|uniref:N-acetyltransferase domain-containing protein n=1 Tax=Talaromyces rugulosus TaxID=121627 RepID=A0A7H8QPV9_TALRU|nr:uncharacterized protein TRUGW13939_02998 [Talaromyces rugulosus]QKX55899.1 hypothetical protein TRUGW13939_02998 [Talaromyces rugulosus]
MSSFTQPTELRPQDQLIAIAAMADVYLVPKPAQSQPSDISLLIERYRTTRLTALQLDPDAFGSTYAREIQFTDEIWLSRLLNPLSKTLVSVDVKPPPTEPVDLARHEWLGTATILGPKVLSETKGSSLWTTYTRDNSNDPPDWPAVKDSNAIYMIAGVFVHPSRRRQGRGKRLIRAVVSTATEEAKSAGASRVTILLEIESENQVPDRLYESAGFWAVDREAGVRQNVQQLLEYSQNEKKRNFLETVELQIGLKNYDPQRDKRFSGTIRLPNVPRPGMTICVIGDQHDLDRSKHLGIESASVDDLKKLNKNKKLIKKLARKYDAFVASETLLRQIPRILGPGLSRAGKFPTPVSHAEDLEAKVTEVKSTIKFQLKKVLCLGVAVGNVGMTEDELISNIMLAINYLVSLLKKGWQNVGSLVIKASMSPPKRLY